jgi:hypothetical protein
MWLWPWNCMSASCSTASAARAPPRPRASIVASALGRSGPRQGTRDTVAVVQHVASGLVHRCARSRGAGRPRRSPARW